MANFNQQGQSIAGNQYNAEVINIGAVETRQDLLVELCKLQQELEKAAQASAIDEEAAVGVGYALKKAIQLAKKSDGDKSIIQQYLQTATGHLHGAKNLMDAFNNLISVIPGMT